MKALLGPKLLEVKAKKQKTKSFENIVGNPDELETQPLVSGSTVLGDIPLEAPQCLEEILTQMELGACKPFHHSWQYKAPFRALCKRLGQGAWFHIQRSFILVVHVCACVCVCVEMCAF